MMDPWPIGERDDRDPFVSEVLGVPFIPAKVGDTVWHHRGGRDVPVEIVRIDAEGIQVRDFERGTTRWITRYSTEDPSRR